jgi:GxxExxY protein
MTAEAQRCGDTETFIFNNLYKSIFMTREQLNALGAQILDACISVHKEVGPGLLESVYVFALLIELKLRGINAVPKVAVPLLYKGHDTGKYYEMDILVEGEIIIEAKAGEIMHPVYSAQMISYLNLANKCLGYLVNFNVVRLKDGFSRFVNKF